MSDLIQFIQECRANNSGQRFGQLLFNILAEHDGREDGYDEHFHSRLFYIDDHELVSILKEYEGKKLIK